MMDIRYLRRKLPHVVFLDFFLVITIYLTWKAQPDNMAHAALHVTHDKVRDKKDVRENKYNNSKEFVESECAGSDELVEPSFKRDRLREVGERFFLRDLPPVPESDDRLREEGAVTSPSARWYSSWSFTLVIFLDFVDGLCACCVYVVRPVIEEERGRTLCRLGD